MRWPYNRIAKAELTSAFVGLLYIENMPHEKGFCPVRLQRQPVENQIDTLPGQDDDSFMNPQNSTRNPEGLSSGE